MRWAAITITCPAAGEESVADALTGVGCGGAAVERSVDGGSAQRPGLCRVTGYLPVDDRLERRLVILRTRLRELSGTGLPVGDGRLTVRWVEEEDWAHAWKQFFRPFRVGRGFVIRPTWEDWVESEGDRVLAIDPGMAFGTGSHPTTRLCLELIEDRIRPGQSVLDVGAGSGILAIAAAALGATPIIGIDLDPVAVAAARANVAVNPTARGIGLVVGEARCIRASFDWVFANLIAETIRAEARSLAERLRPDGALLASGIVAERAPAVREALEAQGLRLEEERRDEEWVALVARQFREADAAG